MPDKTTQRLNAVRIDNNDLRVVYNLTADKFTIELPPSGWIPFDLMDRLLVGLGIVRKRREVYQKERTTTTRKRDNDDQTD